MRIVPLPILFALSLCGAAPLTAGSRETKATAAKVKDDLTRYSERRKALENALQDETIDRKAVFQSVFRITDRNEMGIVRDAVASWLAHGEDASVPISGDYPLAKEAFLSDPRIETRVGTRDGVTAGLVLDLATDPSNNEQIRGGALKLLLYPYSFAPESLERIKDLARSNQNTAVRAGALRLWAKHDRKSPQLHGLVLKFLEEGDRNLKRGGVVAALELGTGVPAAIKQQVEKTVANTPDLLAGHDAVMDTAQMGITNLVALPTLERAFSSVEDLRKYKEAICYKHFDLNNQAPLPSLRSLSEEQVRQYEFLTADLDSRYSSGLVNRIPPRALLPYLTSEDPGLREVAKSLARRLLKTSKNQGTGPVLEKLRLLAGGPNPTAQRAAERLAELQSALKERDPLLVDGALSKFQKADFDHYKSESLSFPWKELAAFMEKYPNASLNDSYLHTFNLPEAETAALNGLKYLMASTDPPTRLAAARSIAGKLPEAAEANQAINVLLENSVDRGTLSLLARMTTHGHDLKKVNWQRIADKLIESPAGRHDALEILSGTREPQMRAPTQRYLLPLLADTDTESWGEKNALNRIRGVTGGRATKGTAAEKAAQVEERKNKALAALADPTKPEAHKAALETLKVLKIKMGEKAAVQKQLLLYLNTEKRPELRLMAVETILHWRGSGVNEYEQKAMALLGPCTAAARNLSRRPPSN